MNQTMPISQKFNLLQMLIDESHIHLIMDKLLQEVKQKNQKKLESYNKYLQKFETQYGMNSYGFYEKFEKGQLGDDMDFFEWSGVVELRNHLIEKLKVFEDL